MSFQQRLTEDRRLVILRLLAEIPGYECNSSILQEGLDSFGHAISRDTVHVDLAWLAEQSLVTLEEVATVKIATLTGRGLDVAQGRAVVPGVKRPGPRDH